MYNGGYGDGDNCDDGACSSGVGCDQNDDYEFGENMMVMSLVDGFDDEGGGCYGDNLCGNDGCL